MERHNTYTTSIILKDFRSFYKELLLLKSRAFQGATKGSVTSDTSNPGGPSPKPDAHNEKKEDATKTEDTLSTEENHSEPDQKEAPPQPKPSSIDHQSVAQEIRERLETVLTSQYRELGSNKGGYAARYYEEAQYIMVSLADETFINLNWSGKEEWEDNLLESLMYNTQDAGDKFFENLDMFLERAHSSQTTDMAALYLIALGLGFKGKYRDAEYEATLAKYKERLYRYITSEDPALLHNQSHLFPESYANIIGDRQSIQMPNIRAWWLSLCVIGGGFVIGSSIIWLHHMQGFSPLVDALQKWAEV